MTAERCDGLPDVTRIISPGAERPWPCDNTQSRPEQVCVTSVTRVSNLSHLSSNPYTRSTGELSPTLTEPRQPDTDPGPVRLQPVSSTRLGPGLQLKSSLATTEDRL